MSYQIVISSTAPLPPGVQALGVLNPAQAEAQLNAFQQQEYDLAFTVASTAKLPQGPANFVEIPVVVYTMKRP
jgi:hypothetical protein